MQGADRLYWGLISVRKLAWHKVYTFYQANYKVKVQHHVVYPDITALHYHYVIFTASSNCLTRLISASTSFSSLRAARSLSGDRLAK